MKGILCPKHLCKLEERFSDKNDSEGNWIKELVCPIENKYPCETKLGTFTHHNYEWHSSGDYGFFSHYSWIIEKCTRCGNELRREMDYSQY